MCRNSTIATIALLALLCAGCAGSRHGGPAPGGAQNHTESASAQFLREQLSQLEVLPAPDGVASAEWSGLKSALASSIRGRLAAGAKAVLAAPTSGTARTRLRYNHDDGRFDFRIYNPGDYNQDGEVNISDLTPLGARLGQSVPAGPEGENSIQSVVDGDGNGLITIADLTPLGAYLGRRITGFGLYHSLVPESLPDSYGAPSEIEEFHYEPFSDARGEPNLERLWMSFTIVPLVANNLYWMRPWDEVSGTEGTPSTVLDAGEEFTPVLNAEPLSGSAPLSVVFDGGDSNNYESFAFDPEGDGSYTPASDDAVQNHVYEEQGLHTAVMRVESAGGNYRSVDVLINVGEAPDWRIQTLPQTSPIDPTGIGIVGYLDRPGVVVTYLATVAGNHQIAAYGGATAAGSAWRERQTLQTAASAYGDVIMKNVGALGGQPAIAYKTSTGFAYRRSGAEPFVDNWGPTKSFDSVGSSFGMDGMTFQPFVAFRFDVGGSPTLEVNASQNSDGDMTWHRWPPLQGFSTPSQISCEMIGYSENLRRGITALNDGELIYLEGDDLNPPDTWEPPVTIAIDNIRSFNSLVRLDDRSPGLVYHSLDSLEAVVFRRATDPSGDDWNPVDQVIIDEVPGSGGALVPTAVMVGDIPYAFWIEPTTDLLYWSSATGPDAGEWTVADIVANNVDQTVLPAAADINGNPAVGYATEAGEFKVALFY